MPLDIAGSSMLIQKQNSAEDIFNWVIHTRFFFFYIQSWQNTLATPDIQSATHKLYSHHFLIMWVNQVSNENNLWTSLLSPLWRFWNQCWDLFFLHVMLTLKIKLVLLTVRFSKQIPDQKLPARLKYHHQRRAKQLSYSSLSFISWVALTKGMHKSHPIIFVLHEDWNFRIRISHTVTTALEHIHYQSSTR